MIRWFALLFIYSVTFYAQSYDGITSNLAATAAGDPSSIVEGKVNALTGQPCIYSDDLIVQGAEPIRISRFLSSENGWKIGPSLAEVQPTVKGYRIVVWDKSGFPLIYKRESKVKIGDEVHERFTPSKKNTPMANTYQGKISGRTNLKNNVILLDEQRKKILTVTQADGTMQRYKRVRNDKTNYVLQDEHLPNGNWIIYEYEETEAKEGRIFNIMSIRSMNPSRTKEFARATFIYTDKTRKNRNFRVCGSDGQSVEYRYRKDQGTGEYYLDTVVLPNGPDQKLGYFKYGIAKTDGTRNPLNEQHDRLESVAFANSQTHKFDFYRNKTETVAGQNLQIEDLSYLVRDSQGNPIFLYERDFRKNRVKTLYAPVGSNPQAEATHSLIYGFRSPYGSHDHRISSNGIVSVYDILGARTDYTKFGPVPMLTGIFHSINTGEICRSEQFEWEWDWDLNNPFVQLAYKMLRDGKGKPISCNLYVYDDQGNIIEEKLLGNLTGLGSITLRDKQRLLAESAPFSQHNTAPVPDLSESFGKRCRYSGLPFNLLLEESDDSGLRCVYEYLLGTDLPVCIWNYDQDRLLSTKTYVYNKDHVLIRETTDDGLACLIKDITPIEEAPYIGMPKVILEKYLDQSQEKLLKKTVLQYGAGGRIEQKDIYDADDVFCYSLKMRYDQKGRLIASTNAIGQEAISRYDECGRLVYHKDFSGRLETINRYDYSNCLYEKEEIGFDGRRQIIRYKYDKKQNLVGEIDACGQETLYICDTLGRRTETHFPDGSVHKTTYDGAGNPAIVTDAEEGVTETTYTLYRKPGLVTHPDGTQEKYTYTAAGHPKTHVDQRGILTSYEVDVLGRITRKTISSTNGVLAEEHFEYQGSQLICKTDAEGSKTLYRYDGAGRKIAEECNNEVIGFSYDRQGRLHTIQTGDLLTIREYNLLGRLVEEREESTSGILHASKTFELDSAGNQIIVVQGDIRNEFAYDSANRLVRKQDALGNVETISYDEGFINDARQKVLCKTHVDPIGLQIIEVYDIMGRVASIEIKKDKTLSIEKNRYSPAGRLIERCNTITYSENVSHDVHTRWRHDQMGKIIELIEAAETMDARITRHEYGVCGELVQTIKPDGVMLTYQYHDLGFLAAIDSSDGSVHHRMQCNRLGSLIETDGVKRTVDTKGRILTESFARGFALQNLYDARGRRVACRIPEANCLIETEYNASSRKRTVRKNLQGEELYSHTYLERNLLGQVLKEQMIHGGLVQYDRDRTGRKISIALPGFSENAFFDPAGNTTMSQIQGETIQFEYDDLYQLTSESGKLFTHRYLFDSLYNRLQKDEEAYRINDLQQVVSHGKYDLNGNLVQWKDSNYFYDAMNRLIRIEKPGFTQTFRYDALHRCLEQITTTGSEQKTRYFLYDGQNEIGAFDEALKLIELRVLGDAPHAEIGASIAIELEGSIYAPIHDLHGNIALLVSIHDGSSTTYRYSAFGEEKIDGSVFSPWRFSSKRSDPETGLVYYGRRFYIPDLGRWLTPDPAGFTDGMNLYAFVHNCPLTRFDEYGLEDWDNRFWRMYQTAKERGEHVLQHPRFQGAMQAFGGLVEAGIGGGMTYASGGTASALGWPVFVHGLDQFITGMDIALTGKIKTTATEYVLQKAGLSHQKASFANDLMSVGGSMGGMGALRYARSTAFTNYCLPKDVNFTKVKLWPEASRGRQVINGIEYSVHALERMSPRGLIQRGTEMVSRGIPPSVVENAIKYGIKSAGNTPSEVIHVFENIRVVTNHDSTRIITVITTGR